MSSYQVWVSVDALCALLDCALGISPVTSYSGVKLPGLGRRASRRAVERSSKSVCSRALVQPQNIMQTPSFLCTNIEKHRAAVTFC